MCILATVSQEATKLRHSCSGTSCCQWQRMCFFLLFFILVCSFV